MMTSVDDRDLSMQRKKAVKSKQFLPNERFIDGKLVLRESLSPEQMSVFLFKKHWCSK